MSEMPNIKTNCLGRNIKLRYYKDVFGGSKIKFNIVLWKTG
jgi:hypothetical protein